MSHKFRGNQVLNFKLRWHSSDPMKLLERLLPEFDSTRSNYYFQSDAVCFLMFLNQRQTEMENKAQFWEHYTLEASGSSIPLASCTC